MADRASVSAIVLTRNAGKELPRLLSVLKSQTNPPSEIIVADTCSTDDTPRVAESLGARVLNVCQTDFDHGNARTASAKASSGEFVVFMTQDALPDDGNAISRLIAPLIADPTVAACYGRQIPSEDASHLSAHLRDFNYPDKSIVKAKEDRAKYGIKTPFLSNAFCAYRRSAMEEIGWFKERLIVSEDTYAGAKLLLAGHKLAYAADAVARHSHNYGIIEEFRRYFDIGVFHAKESWILKEFGGSEREGFRYIMSEISYLSRHRLILTTPEFLTRNAMKYLGYRLGRWHGILPCFVCKSFSRQKTWWYRKDKG